MNKLSFLGAYRSISDTTSTGAGLAQSCPPLDTLTVQVVVNGTGTGTAVVQGSLDGTNWSTIFTSTYQGAGRTVSSSTILAVTNVRASISAHGSTAPVTVFLAGR